MENGAKTASSRSPSIARRIVRWVLRLAAAALLFVFLFHAWIFSRIWWLRAHNPQSTAFMQQGLQRLHEKNPDAQLRHQWVDYERISAHLKRAVIAAEDQKFLDHEGFDWNEMEKAYDANQKGSRIRRGASTISQQLAKNLFLSSQRSYVRKAEEAIFATMIERILEKRPILEIYLNVIEWGEGIYGAQAAARHYFGKNAASLEAEEAAWLAAIVPHPRFYDRRRTTPYIERRAAILMKQSEWIKAP